MTVAFGVRIDVLEETMDLPRREELDASSLKVVAML